MSNKKTTGGKISYEQKMSVISSRIRRGDQTIISAKTGYASSTVSEVLSGKRTQTDLERLLSKKKLTVAETLDLYKRGLKPYFVSVKENMLVELTVENENDRTTYDMTTHIKWFHPKIAEKIQARYQEINDLVQKKGAAIRECDSQIEELKLRISMIEERGTDLII